MTTTDSKNNNTNNNNNDNSNNNNNTIATLETAEYNNENVLNENMKEGTNARAYPLWKDRFGRAKQAILLTLTAKDSKKDKTPVFRRRNFFAPTLILFTFVLFVVIPDTLNLFFHYAETIKLSEDTQNILLCLYSLGFIMDGFIYIFLQKHLRNMLLKVCSRRKWVERHTTQMSQPGGSQ